MLSLLEKARQAKCKQNIETWEKNGLKLFNEVISTCNKELSLVPVELGCDNSAWYLAGNSYVSSQILSKTTQVGT